MDLSVFVAGLPLKNPVLTASGTFGYGREAAELYDLSVLGGVMVKGVSREPWPGNAPVRVARAPGGMLNAIGLQNPGLEHFLMVDLPFLRQYDTAVVVNVVGHDEEGFVEVVRGVTGQAGVAAIELNISCPNVKDGLLFSQDPASARRLVEAARRETDLPLIVKVSPNVTDPVQLGHACREGGADALSAINTLLGMAIDPVRRSPVLGNRTGGLSGPAVKPVGLRIVYDLAAQVGLPVVGMGGIETGRDALEYILAGARAVAVGTAVFRDPFAPPRIVGELAAELGRHGFESAAQAWAAANPQAREAVS
ncbi:MAG: dihydroorotate dehydrogenase [Thermaerobacter sp.]|nr:dihydroorotate dehydrogenase [Thermaerobacter sp.]